jgi:Flp pilus assembly protein TadD
MTRSSGPRPRSSRAGRVLRRTGSRAAPADWLVVAAAATATYLTALPNRFVFDAWHLIPGNAALRESHEWLAWFGRPYFWGTNVSGSFLYRPLTTLSYLGTIRLAGVEPLPFMIGNVLLHAGVSVLVLALGRRLLGAAAGLLGALIFAVHPLHTEAVAWVGGRTDLLATLFAVGSALAFLRATAHRARRPALWVGGAASAYFAALLSKEHVITLPAWFALAWLLGPRPRSPRWPVGALVGSAAIPLLAYVALKAGAHESVPRSMAFLAGRMVQDVGAPWRWLAGLGAAGTYGMLFVWPRALTYDHTLFPIAAARSVRVEALAGAVLVVGFLGALVWAVRAHRGLALILAWVPLTYAVVSAFPLTPQLYVAERLTYLPSVGACLAAGWTLLRLAQWASRGPEAGAARATSQSREPSVPAWLWSGWRGRMAAAVLLGLLGALAWRSAIRNLDWRSNETVARAAVAISPDSPLALAELGFKEYGRGNLAAARAFLERSLRLNPKAWEPYELLGRIHVQQGDTLEAIRVYREAADHLPRSNEIVHNLATLLLETGRADEAEPLLRAVVDRAPGFLPSRLVLGRLLLETGHASEALEHFRAASALDPKNPAAWFGMASASLALGHLTDARVYAQRAQAAGFSVPDDFLRAVGRAGTP